MTFSKEIEILSSFLFKVFDENLFSSKNLNKQEKNSLFYSKKLIKAEKLFCLNWFFEINRDFFLFNPEREKTISRI